MSTHRIVNLYADALFSSAIVLIIEAAEDEWETIHALTAGLVQAAPGKIQKLFFCGNRTGYSVSRAQKITELLTGAFSSNMNRVSMIGPIFELLEKENFAGEIAVICAHPPVDLMDWYDTEMLAKTLFIPVHDKEKASFIDDIQQIPGRAGAGKIIHELHNPVCEVVLQGRGFVPLRWTMPAKMTGSVELKDGSFRLRIPIAETRFELHLQALCLPAACPQLSVRRKRTNGTVTESGMEEPVDALKEENVWFEAQQWKPIPDQLISVLEAKRNRRSYRCPQCGGQHDHTTLSCPFGGPVLTGMPLNSCLLFTGSRYLDLSEVNAFSLHDGNTIITRQGEIYHADKGRWDLIRTVNSFEEVDNGIWALFNSV